MVSWRAKLVIETESRDPSGKKETFTGSLQANSCQSVMALTDHEDVQPKAHSNYSVQIWYLFGEHLIKCTHPTDICSQHLSC